MMGKWMTLQEVMDEFGVAERTFHSWRKRHPIRAGHITRRHPLMFHRDDVLEADYKENVAGNEKAAEVAEGTCYAGA
jgi:hypothetical protein